eukprot:scaffold199172_cov17-Tisochrysis_lutea.AAC.1
MAERLLRFAAAARPTTAHSFRSFAILVVHRPHPAAEQAPTTQHRFPTGGPPSPSLPRATTCMPIT